MLRCQKHPEVVACGTGMFSGNWLPLSQRPIAAACNLSVQYKFDAAHFITDTETLTGMSSRSICTAKSCPSACVCILHVQN